MVSSDKTFGKIDNEEDYVEKNTLKTREKK
jgi:hypothetical protein